MKGLILSIGGLVACFCMAVMLLRMYRPPRPAPLLILSYVLSLPVYFIIYAVTPHDLWFLPASWTADGAVLDSLLGCAFLSMNFHSFLDFFFAVNGGFSTCLMAVVLQHRHKGITTGELASIFQSRQGHDKITAWRLPRLVETGYLAHDPATDLYSLTAKGRRMAHTVRFFKLLLNVLREEP